MTQIISLLKDWFKNIDWILISAIIPIVGFGLVTMNSFVDTTSFFEKQLIWLSLSFPIFIIFSLIDFKFLRRTSVVIWLYGIAITLLTGLFILGATFKGAQSWFSFAGLSFQPADFAKLVLIFVLAKYFSRRHIEIKNFKHIVVSGIYAFILFVLVALQPDFGSALIIFMIWFGMVMVSGISKKHLLLVFTMGLLAFGGLWFFVFQDYQKERILTFVNPLYDIQGPGYNAYQSTITVGSGQFLGKGIGEGTQSRLNFLPEYETDFIFAAYAEEWGFVGVLILFGCYGLLFWRILQNAYHGATNFEILFALGLGILFMSHFIIHVGMNIGVLPITGLTLPFMSYGGTNLLFSFAALGILMGMRRYSRTVHKELAQNEFVGI